MTRDPQLAAILKPSIVTIANLPDTDDGVGDEDEEDDERLDEGGDRVVILEEGEDEGDNGGEEQDLDQQVVELLEDQLEHGLANFGGQLWGGG